MKEKGFVSLWDLRDELPDEEIMWTYEQVRGAFEEDHPHNMVNARDAFVLTVNPFGWDDEHPYDYETETWETFITALKMAVLETHGDRSPLLHELTGPVSSRFRGLVQSNSQCDTKKEEFIEKWHEHMDDNDE